MEDGGQQRTSQVLIGDDCKLSDCLDTTEILYLGHQHPAVHCSTILLEKVEYQPAQSNSIMFLYCIVVVHPIPGGCGWCGCRDKISFCKQSKFVPAQCSSHPAWVWGTTAANNTWNNGNRDPK